eukprot:TRINITY_DN3696_c0_g1_i1.p1 TRINITY_DN3696_c0_g1~~TRINITY_DN3696_c0_g1_i1.p1  ORF type:complete len:591 (+),score=207.66 TRINITY_DN3696_c0_g1_i1:120-1775(+)
MAAVQKHLRHVPQRPTLLDKRKKKKTAATQKEVLDYLLKNTAKSEKQGDAAAAPPADDDAAGAVADGAAPKKGEVTVMPYLDSEDGPSSATMARWAWVQKAQEQAARDHSARARRATLPPDAEKVVVDPASVMRPDFVGLARTGDDRMLHRRQRPGTQLVQSATEWLEATKVRGPGAIDLWDRRCKQLVDEREAQLQERTLAVHPYRGCNPAGMNMDEEVVAACCGIMQVFDVTYASFRRVQDVIEAAKKLQSVGAVDSEQNVSHAFCLVYTVFLLGTSKNQLKRMVVHENAYVRAIGLICCRYVFSPRVFCQFGSVVQKDNSLICIDEGSATSPKEEVTMVEFVTRLHSAGPEFLEANFPEFTPLEQQYVLTSLSAWQEKQRQWAARRAEEEADPGTAEKKARREAESQRWAKSRRQLCSGTMLYGFQNVGSMVGWATFQGGTDEQRAAAVESARLQAEQQRLSEHVRAAASLDDGKKFVTSVEIPQDKPVGAAQKRKDQKKRRREREAAEEAGGAHEDKQPPPEPASKKRRKKKAEPDHSDDEDCPIYL